MNFNLDKIKEEIGNRKSMKSEQAKVLGEQTNAPVSRDQFLAELQLTRSTGQQTSASKKVSAVAKVSDAKANKKSIDTTQLSEDILNHAKNNSINTNVNKPVNNNHLDKQKLFEIEEMARQKKQFEAYQPTPISNEGLYDSMMKYQGTASPTQQQMNNGYLNEQQMRELLMKNNAASNTQSQQINEQLSNIATNFLNENFGALFSEALKQSIVETYKAERVKKGIEENKEMIKDIVIETIRELQKRTQTKK